jgi:hypothetical protein
MTTLFVHLSVKSSLSEMLLSSVDERVLLSVSGSLDTVLNVIHMIRVLWESTVVE